jgi:sialate O-acetylesterase
MKIKITFLLILLLSIASLGAEIHLPSLIANNMVLQQQSSVKLWGTAKPNSKVTVVASWSSKCYFTQSDSNGDWLLSIKTPIAGGPFSIVFSDGKAKKIENVLIGEVWLCSGQSNMEMPMKGYSGQPVHGAQNTIASADPSLPIRLCKLEKQKNIQPQSDCKLAWNENNPQSVREFSSVGYYFALQMQKVLKVPVGIIVSAWGGSAIESWMDSLSLSQISLVNTPKTNSPIGVNPKNCELYNAMLYPLHNFKIKGALWYQGEANASNSQKYKKLFPAMVAQWRNLWGAGDFPFYFAQIAPWMYSKVDSTESALQREVQAGFVAEVPNSGMVVTLDTGDPFIIHPRMKREIGERFSYLALAKTYGIEGIECQSPQFSSMKISKDTIVVDFKFAPEGLYSSDKKILGFEIAGSDYVFKPANATFISKATKVRLLESSIANPVAVRYGFRNYMPVSVFNNLGFPLAPFRSDY